MKPAYEELEQQLAAVTAERDACEKAERTWETTMMEACGEDGPASVSAEIRALREQRDTALESLRQQLAAVVAENTALKSAKEIIRHLNANREEANFCGIDDCYIDDAVAAMITPATEAFLSEVRIEACNALVDELEAMFKRMSNNPDFAPEHRSGAAGAAAVVGTYRREVSQ